MCSSERTIIIFVSYGLSESGTMAETRNDTTYLTDYEVEVVVAIQLTTAALSCFASLVIILIMLWLNQLKVMSRWENSNSFLTLSRVIFVLIVCCCFYGVSYLFGAAFIDDPDVENDRK